MAGRGENLEGPWPPPYHTLLVLLAPQVKGSHFVELVPELEITKLLHLLKEDPSHAIETLKVSKTIRPGAYLMGCRGFMGPLYISRENLAI
jgi:hypothetical protein